MVTPHVMHTPIFPTYRAQSKYLTVRAGSEYHDDGGTIHNVTGGFYHESFNLSNADYDVAVLKVCIDFDIPTDSANYVTWLH
jgi:hypothetical protein